MDDDDNGRVISGSSVIATAQYDSAIGGEQKQVSLVDAVRPLLGPVSHQLLLSNRPISVPWPLAVDERTVAHDDERQSKRKRRADELSEQVDLLQNQLGREIPCALEQLQCSMQEHQQAWLTSSKAERVIVAEGSKLCSKQGNRIGLDWVRLEAEKESKRVGSSSSKRELTNSSCSNVDADELIHRLVANGSHSGSNIACNTIDDSNTQIYMPPRSAFLLTNVLRSQTELPRGWDQLLAFADKHPPNLILLDPPYPNFSAKRLKIRQEAYEPVGDLYDLWNMKRPIQQLLQRGPQGEEGVLIGCWVTNHAKVQRFILTKLFLEWGLEHIGQLVWIKVTAGNASESIAGGQLVFPLNNKQGRKPYEILLLGHSKRPTLETKQTTLFASVPIGHSRKPAVLDLLRPLLPHSRNINIYEIFARSLFPGPSSEGHWVSIGNEPFTFSQRGVGYHVVEEGK